MAIGKLPFPIYLLAILLALGGCATQHSVPVVDGTRPAVKNIPKSSTPATLQYGQAATHTVQKGDTLYSIALQYGLDYRDLERWNNLPDNYLIHIGQVLKLTAPQQQGDGLQTAPAESTVQTIPLRIEPLPQGQAASNAPLITQPKIVKLPYSDAALAQLAQGSGTSSGPTVQNSVSAAVPEVAPVAASPQAPSAPTATNDSGIDWIWPTQGRVIAGFDEAKNSKGLDIAGKAGQAIFASAAGKVVYSGEGLRGYGKMVIIKHNPTYLSAYAHNQLILVKEGQTVARGQKIAEMGDSDSDQVELHFEIRKMGKPVDPMTYLPGAQK
ncbi:MAG: peptidoglycan DD-metalloendopeptidase family protein [Pseudomonadota bacterium]